MSISTVYNTVSSYVKASPTWVKLIVGAGLAFGGYEYQQHGTLNPLAPASVQSSTDLATKQEGDKVRMTFVVEGGVKLKDGKVLLNNMKDYKDPACLTLVCTEQQVSDPKSIIGKTATVEGTRVSYKGKPQIKVEKIEVK